MAIKREQIDSYAATKTKKILEAIDNDSELKDLNKEIKDKINLLNNRAKEMANSIYPGINELDYVGSYLGVAYLNDLYKGFDATREVADAIRRDVTEKLIDDSINQNRMETLGLNL